MSSRVKKLKDKFWDFKRGATQYSIGIDQDEMETTLAIKEENDFTTEWFAPEDHKGVHLEERSLERKLLSEEEIPIRLILQECLNSPSTPLLKKNT